jgi:ABC-type multidrug transport system ATPase subunit
VIGRRSQARRDFRDEQSHGEVHGLRKAFGEVQALDGLSLAVPAGSVLGLLGPNGSGKTTAVSILATSLRPDAGRATVGGLDVVTGPSPTSPATCLSSRS